MYYALVDSSATINLVHKSVVFFLELTVQPHLGLLVFLVDNKMMLSSSSNISLLCTITGKSYHSSFFVTLLGVQLIIVDMSYLKWENAVINWAATTLTLWFILHLQTIPPMISPTISTSIAPSLILLPISPQMSLLISSNAIPPSIPSIPLNPMFSNLSLHHNMKLNTDLKLCINMKSHANVKLQTNVEPLEFPVS